MGTVICFEVFTRNPRDGQPWDQTPQGGLNARRARPVQGVVQQGIPLVTRLPADPIHVEEALVEQAITAPRGRVGDETHHGDREAGCWPEPAQAQCVDQDELCEVIAVVHGVPRGDRATHEVACRERLCVAGRLDQLVEPRQYGSRVERAVDDRGFTVAGQVRNDDLVGLHQLRITLVQTAANSPWPCKSTIGGPAPPFSTTVEVQDMLACVTQQAAWAFRQGRSRSEQRWPLVRPGRGWRSAAGCRARRTSSPAHRAPSGSESVRRRLPR